MTKNELPIGIFDSGVGGLTVLRALQEVLPQESFLYLGDTARLPYGTKSPETVRQYALNATEVLVERGIKALVVACNTASSAALDALHEKYGALPVFGVIAPGVAACLSVPSQGTIVVLATEGTVQGGSYHRAFAERAPHRAVIAWPCSLLVALAEEGWCHGPLVEQIVTQLLLPSEILSAASPPACFLLGCTHFPVLKTAIQNVVKEIPVIDPAHQLACLVRQFLETNHLLSHKEKGSAHFMATDSVTRFARVAAIFLKKPLFSEEVECIVVPTLPLDAIWKRAAGER